MIWHSIIISLKNDSFLLKKTLDSIIVQDKDLLNKIEVIIFDSNSTDLPYGLISLYKKKINIIFKSQYDKLIYEAWNKAILIASGKYISFLGSGDILTKNSLKKLYKISSKYFENTIITSQSILLTKDNKKFISGKKFNYGEFKLKFTTNHSLLMYSKDIFEKHGNFSLNYDIAGDYEFLLRIGKYVKTKYLNYPTCYYPIGGISSRNIKPMLLDYKIRRSFKFNPIYVDSIIFLKGVFIFLARSIIGFSYGKKIL